MVNSRHRGADEPAATEVNLPRSQSGPQPQHLLVTLLGDYWYERAEHLPSAALVALLAEFDISPVAARAALSRLARRGLLESSKAGRRTYYGLTRRAGEVLRDGVQRIMSFGANTATWDQAWRVAVFSVPEEQRDVRHAVRTQLRWLGFAPLYDGVWVSPRDAADAASEQLTKLGVTNFTVLTGQFVAEGPGGKGPLAAWDLEELRQRYGEFIATHEPLLHRTRDGSVGAAEALFARTELMDTWRHFPNLDPELPSELLPPDWPRQRAHALFGELYDALGPLAEIRVRQVISHFSPELGALVRFHTMRSVIGTETSGSA